MRPILAAFAQTLTLSPLILVVAALWLLSFIVVPIIKWVWGDDAEHIATNVATIAQVVFCSVLVLSMWPTGRAVLALIAVPAIGWAFEFVGSQTGVPFGRYAYTDRLQPQIGHVPILIPLAWLMMAPSTWAIGLVVGRHLPLPPRFATALVAGIAFAAWDFFVDPQMTGADFWRWERRGGYFGIPWVNFAGWALAGFTMAFVVGPTEMETSPLIVVYVITWFLQTFAHALFWRRPGPAAAGFAAMGAVLVATAFALAG